MRGEAEGVRRASATFCRSVTCLVPVLALALAGCTTLPTAEQIERGAERLEHELRSLENEGFAGQVLVARGDEVLLLSGYGAMGLDDPRPVTDNAVMPLASITKPFTASAIFVLAAEGKLALDDPIGQFLDELDSPWGDIPVQALLTHSAGLPAEIVRHGRMEEHRFEPIDRNTFLQRVQHFEPDFEPGAGFRYGNVSYGLLAAIIEVVAEQSWESFLIGSVLNTAGVADIGVFSPGWHDSEMVRARDGERDLGHYLEQPRLADGLGYNIRGAGDLHARPAGVLAWWQAMRQEFWLSPPWMDRWLEPQISEPDGSRYGYGLHFRRSPWGPVIGHTGGEAGFTSDFSWFTELDLVVYINSAHTDFEADLLRDRLHRQLLGKR